GECALLPRLRLGERQHGGEDDTDLLVGWTVASTVRAVFLTVVRESEVRHLEPLRLDVVGGHASTSRMSEMSPSGLLPGSAARVSHAWTISRNRAIFAVTSIR